MQLEQYLQQRMGQYVGLRRDIHAHPELSFNEHRTASVVAQTLHSWGIETHTGIAKTGVVGVIRKGQHSQPGARSIGLRADMDALPMQEINTFDHASRHPGKMHGCGHDGHTAMLLAAADYLQHHAEFDGTVVLLFQPAEEGGGGAREMVAEGVFERFPVDAVFGVHNWPGLAEGTLAASPGPVMASSNEFRIVIRGKGGHAAMPHNAIDPVVVACQLVQGFQTIVSRNVKPIDAAVISVTMIHAGEATNVIPNSCELQGTVRTFSLEVLDQVEQRMRDMTHALCSAFGAQADFEFQRNYPPTINAAAETEFARQVMQRVFGESKVVPQEPTMGAEDFAYMLLAKPGCYAFIGNGDGDHRAIGHGGGPCMLHNPSYDFNDALLPVGARYWVELAKAWLAR
ncbi:amidohydrolase [Curvibacter sp. CHRR-16]|uniref:M20 aminoacylase family protein n=1 Tax=Curvibacter sp. CHRR-16 TaxID=2835872 RepID=UPI001BDB2C8A|nr:M20 aminoacylase family protein [Curvibacter sp. CHRR-16]MBT0569812.1 amidohydrolase [Curvibacter sp. CHRR-16]